MHLYSYPGLRVTPSVDLPPEPHSVKRAREFVTATLVEAGLEPWPASLLVTELATNVVDHARSAYTVDVEVSEVVRVVVRDGQAVLPAVRDAAADAERGRGMALLEKLALRWGADLDGPGKRVWFEVAKQRCPS